MRRSILFLASALCTLSLFPALYSQSEDGVTRAPDGGVSEHVDGIFIPAISGAPFSARLNADISSQLPDGTTVEKKFINMLARDSEGRIYKERRRIVPADSPGESPLTQFTILDTPARTRTVCEVAERTCRITQFVEPGQAGEAPVGPSRDGKSYLTRENLGTTTMNNLDVQYSRETRTFNAGAFGNNRPVAVVKEFWYSPQLQINLAVTRNDPRTSVQKLTLSELSLDPPDPSRFAIPNGFRVIDLRTEGGARAEAPGPEAAAGVQ
jgi:hypothetical protein